MFDSYRCAGTKVWIDDHRQRDKVTLSREPRSLSQRTGTHSEFQVSIALSIRSKRTFAHTVYIGCGASSWESYRPN